MATYTLVVSCVPLLRDAEEGWLFDCDVRVLRDGKDDIGGFVQKYGEQVSNQEMRDDIDTILATTTSFEFFYRDATETDDIFYVSLAPTDPYQGVDRETGREERGTHVLTVLEVI